MKTIASILGVALLLVSSTVAMAVSTPPADQNKANAGSLGMLDARVNLKSSFQHAVAARPAYAAAGRNAGVSSAAAVANAVAAHSLSKPGLEARLSNATGGLSSLHNKSGSLTPAAPGLGSETIVRGYLQTNGELFGLTANDLGDLVVLGDSAGGYSGLRMLRVEQQINGIPVFQSETRFTLARDGRLMKAVGLLVPNARALAAGAVTANFMQPEDAVVKLLAAEGRSIDPSVYTSVATDKGFELRGNDGYTAGPITARKTLFPLAPGLLVPAWSLVAFTNGQQDWYAIVDAETGDLLWRKGIRAYASAHDARFRVYVQADGVTPADSPAPQSPTTAIPGAGTQYPEIAPSIVSMHTAMDAIASPNGWIDDCPGGGCTANETQTLGNNALVCLDRAGTANVCDTDAASVLDGNGRPTGNPDSNGRNRDFLGAAPRDFETGFLPAPQGGNPEAGQTATGDGSSGTNALDQFRRGALTHLFYLTNWYHDKLYRLGFDEASGNFQQTNFSGQGLGNDRVLGDAQDASGVNNANFSTPPDGTSGRMQMYRFTGPTIDRDGGLDGEIVFHELTHGTSNRLVGNAAGLNWDPAAGLGEGWSDFYALSLLNNTNADNPDGRYASGAYATYKLSAGYTDNYVYGIRRFPYSTDHAVNPMTWADVDDVTNDLSGGIAPTPIGFNNGGGMEVHNSGEIWTLTLWGVRSRVIADPAGANGDVPTGNGTMLQLVTDALKMTPIDPSFTDARDAIIQADCATNACANEQSIWAGFADRGLGYGAKTPFNVLFGYRAGHLGVHESFSVPFLDVVNVATDVAINDSAPNNNNGSIDPGEAIRMTVRLTNPWRAASKAVTSATATLTTTTPGITIHANSTTYGAIAPGGSATGGSFMFTVAPSVIAGSAIDFTLTTVSSLGTTSTRFQLRVGVASGTDPVVTYTGTPSPGLAIPDNAPRGVVHQITVSDDLVIADLDFRLDNITHTFTGDLTAMLRSPAGIGTDFMSLIGGLTDGGSGDNIVNMVINDDLAVTAANDMAQVLATAAPYTRSWLPVFNAPWTTLAGFPAADAVGNLSRFDGTSTKGAWSILVSDQFASDTGTLNAWSMLVTPVHFNITPVTPSVVPTASMTVAGTFRVGQAVTYTVTLTNNGTANQADNAGNEFVNVLPAGLTLVSASASSGTAAATVGTNTVTWNGSLAPLGGSVTLSITATINAAAQGTTVSNQGTLSYDADATGGSNEATLLTDWPSLAGASDPTTFYVIGTNADLGSLSPSVGSLSPAFNSGTLAYTLLVPNATATMTFAPTIAAPAASVTVNGNTVVSGNNSAPISLSLGSGNVVTIVVTAEDGTTLKTYTITVTRAASSVADLSSLSLSSGSLVPVFSSGTTAYSASVPYGTVSVTLTPALADVNASVTVNGSPVASGVASTPIALSVGSNVINVIVTAQDGTSTRSYTITVTRAAGNFVDLAIAISRQTATEYRIVVSNLGGIASGSNVSVAITLPAGMTATKLEGNDWNCSLPTLICTHFVPLSGNASYPPITLKVPRGHLDTNGQAHPPIGVSVNGENDVNLANNAAHIDTDQGKPW